MDENNHAEHRDNILASSSLSDEEKLKALQRYKVKNLTKAQLAFVK